MGTSATPSPSATGTWEPVIAQELTPFRSSGLRRLTPARPGDLLSSRCTTARSSSPSRLASKSPKDPFSRPTDPTLSSSKIVVDIRCRLHLLTRHQCQQLLCEVGPKYNYKKPK